jgi:hypothetical protein
VGKLVGNDVEKLTGELSGALLGIFVKFSFVGVSVGTSVKLKGGSEGEPV